MIHPKHTSQSNIVSFCQVHITAAFSDFHTYSRFAARKHLEDAVMAEGLVTRLAIGRAGSGLTANPVWSAELFLLHSKALVSAANIANPRGVGNVVDRIMSLGC